MPSLPALLTVALLLGPPGSNEADATRGASVGDVRTSDPARSADLETSSSLPGVPDTYDTTPHVRPIGARTLTLRDVLSSVEA